MYSSYVNSPSNNNNKFKNLQQNAEIKQRNKDNFYINQNHNRFSQTIPIP